MCLYGKCLDLIVWGELGSVGNVNVLGLVETGILKFSQPSLSFSLHGQVTVTTGNIHVFKSVLWLVLITNVLSFS